MMKGDIIMKKIYLKPEIEEIISEKFMQIPLQSVGKTGNVTGESDTNWEFGGDGSSTDTPDAKSGNLWDAWDD